MLMSVTPARRHKTPAHRHGGGHGLYLTSATTCCIRSPGLRSQPQVSEHAARWRASAQQSPRMACWLQAEGSDRARRAGPASLQGCSACSAKRWLCSRSASSSIALCSRLANPGQAGWCCQLGQCICSFGTLPQSALLHQQFSRSGFVDFAQGAKYHFAAAAGLMQNAGVPARTRQCLFCASAAGVRLLRGHMHQGCK